MSHTGMSAATAKQYSAQVSLLGNGIPYGCTHTSEFYGETNYYKLATYQRMNQVSEEWMTMCKWEYWENGRWVDVGTGWSSRRVKKV